MDCSLSNGSDYSNDSDMSRSPLNKKITNNNNHKMTPSMMPRDTFVHFNGEHMRRKNNILKLFILVNVLLLILLAVFVTLYVHTDEEVKQQSRICSSKECVKISARMIETMDQKVDPCDNFYQYSCGGWLKRTPIPDSRTRYSRFEKLSEKNSLVLKQILNELIRKKRNATTPSLEKAAYYYETCMNIQEIDSVGDQPMKDLVEKLGSWPVTNPSFNASKWDAMEALVTVHKNISQAPVFNIYVAGDIKNSVENVLVFDQSGIMMDRESYLQNSTFHRNHRQAYLKMMKAVARQMGANESALEYMDKVFAFETELAKITMSVMQRRDYRLIYQRMTLKQFSEKTEIPMSWLSKFVNKVFKETGSKIPETEEIVSFNTEYVRDAYKLFMNLSKPVQASYVMWNAVKTMAPVVLGKYQDIMDEYFMTSFGTKDRQPRWETCIGSTLGAFGYALSRPFVEEVYDKTAKTMSTEMIQAIKTVFENNLEHMDWMDEKTRAYAKLKASKILDNIGYPDFILNNTALEEEYKGLYVQKGQHFINYMERRKYRNLKNYQKRGKPVDKSQWGILPTTVNAYYAPTENKIGFPAGILQWPFYDKFAPRAVSYGAIGMVVGHEITHGFDDQGKDFTIAGNFDTWWTNSSAKEFAKRSKCFVDQYSNFRLFNKNMKGMQTLGEDLADNGGLRQALQAYRNWVAVHGEEKKLPGLDLSPDQLYFLAFAQVWCTAYRESAAINQIENGVHSLSMFRVIGTLQNNEDFSKAYKCPAGSNMNPSKKCRVW